MVLWEIIRRLESDNQNALTYEVPYQYKVHPDPSFEDMRRVVCTEQYRPEFSPDLKNHKVNSLYFSLITQNLLTEFNLDSIDTIIRHYSRNMGW